MATLNTAETFDLGSEGSEPKEVVNVYQLSSSKLVEILSKLEAHEHFSTNLRSKGIEIYGEVHAEGGFGVYRSMGAITAGSNLGKREDFPYLVTFNPNLMDEGHLWIPSTNLIDVVRDYVL